ncbi:MAG: hypothetical protein L0312_15705, partial [Acidobacteria bacterium]|nr:hypothetical protein [Acidobacteriota bacterium]
LVVGFIAFGNFIYNNLDFRRGHEKGTEQVSQEANNAPQVSKEGTSQHDSSEEGGAKDQRVQRTETGAGMAETETAPQGVSHDRETETTRHDATKAGGVHEEGSTTPEAGAGGESEQPPDPTP